MNQPIESEISPEAFAQSFEQITNRQKNHFVDIGGAYPLPVRGWPSPGSKTLVVLFHGSVNREIRKYPAFYGYRQGVDGHAHQIALSDPSLMSSPDLTNAWFAGSRDTPLQKLLLPFFAQIIEHLGIEKVIFAGGSGGGFAALYYSWHFPGSAAVVSVPQTDIYSYHDRYREAYLAACWPEIDREGEDEELPCLDLRQIYANGMSNSVVYLQSSLDLFHLQHQMLPFLTCLSGPALDRVAVKVSFWGVIGHSNSVPNTELESWIRTLLSLEELSSRGATLEHESVTTLFTAATSPASGPSPAAVGPAEPTPQMQRDRAWAARIAAMTTGVQSSTP